MTNVEQEKDMSMNAADQAPKPAGIRSYIVSNLKSNLNWDARPS